MDEVSSSEESTEIKESQQTGDKTEQSHEQPADQQTESVDHSETAAPESWYYDENVAGTDAAPEWLQTKKYKSVAEQAKAYNEVQKKLGAFKGAPDEYDLKLEEMPDVELQAADPVISEFLEDAKANNVSQEYVTKLLNTYVKGIRMNNPDPKKELEKLGASGKQDIQILGTWAKNSLSTSEVDVFKKMITTADSVRVLQKLRGEMTQADTQPSRTHAPKASKDAILKKIHDPRYATDENFRTQVREELSQFG